MFKSILYKEWIKTRWFIFAYLALAMIGIGVIFLNIQHEFTFSGGKSIWNSILFRDHAYFSHIKFIPIIGGLILGIAQYFPETVDKRIKLLFHLPANENKLLMQILLYGSMLLTLCFAILLALFIGLSVIFFPHEIISDAIVTITPWFLAGYASYFLSGLIVLEPLWRYRVYYLIIFGAFLSLFFKTALIAAYSTFNTTLIIITITLSISLLFSGYRFRKGVQ